MNINSSNKLLECDRPYEIYQLKLSSFNIANYSYIIVDKGSGEAAIVDPAWELDAIFVKFKKLGVHPTAILLTHSHFDHVNLVPSLVELYNSQVYMSQIESQFYGYHSSNLNTVKHFDEINLGKTKITCLLTPGHTAGSVSYLLPDALFTGDTIFVEGCGICNTNGGCPKKMFNSIQMIKSLVAPTVRVYPGHSFGKEPGCSLNHVMIENIYFQIDKEEHFINFRMRKNQKDLFKFY